MGAATGENSLEVLTAETQGCSRTQATQSFKGLGSFSRKKGICPVSLGLGPGFPFHCHSAAAGPPDSLSTSLISGSHPENVDNLPSFMIISWDSYVNRFESTCVTYTNIYLSINIHRCPECSKPAAVWSGGCVSWEGLGGSCSRPQPSWGPCTAPEKGEGRASAQGSVRAEVQQPAG